MLKFHILPSFVNFWCQISTAVIKEQASHRATKFILLYQQGCIQILYINTSHIFLASEVNMKQFMSQDHRPRNKAFQVIDLESSICFIIQLVR